MRKAADTFHPCVGLAYFFAVIAAAMLFMNPFYIAIGLLFAVTAGLIYCGYKTVLKTLLLGLPVCLLIAVFNPLISQGGITPLFFIGGSAFTLEALFYGICSGGMLVLMLLWFCSFNRIVPPEKFLFLFSKISPAASMLVTMTQRMIGLFERRVRAITAAQKTLLCDMSQGGVRARFKSGIRITSILLSWSMEEGLDTADSMKARGYGAAKRSAFSLYRFRLTDAAALLVIAVCFAVCLAGYYASVRFRFYPMIVMPTLTTGYFVSMAAFVLLGLLPVFAEITEAISWRY